MGWDWQQSRNLNLQCPRIRARGETFGLLYCSWCQFLLFFALSSISPLYILPFRLRILLWNRFALIRSDEMVWFVRRHIYVASTIEYYKAVREYCGSFILKNPVTVSKGWILAFSYCRMNRFMTPISLLTYNKNVNWKFGDMKIHVDVKKVY